MTVHIRIPRKLRRRAKPASVLAAFQAWQDAGARRPVVSDEPCSSNVVIRLSDEVVAEIDSAAAGCSLTRSEFLRGLLREPGRARPPRAQKRALPVLASLPAPNPEKSPQSALVRVSRPLVIEPRRPILDGEIVEEPVYAIQRPARGEYRGLTEAQQNKVRNELFTALCESQRENEALRQRLQQRLAQSQPQAQTQPRYANDGSAWARFWGPGHPLYEKKTTS